jgi:hypothetical protein
MPEKVGGKAAMNDKPEMSDCMKRLASYLKFEGELSGKTNQEIGEMLRDRVWAEMNVFSTEAAIIEAAIDRLLGEEGETEND